LELAVPHLLLHLVQLWRSGEIMSITNNLTFKALLTTMGRKTGKEHSVWAKAVTYNDMIYFSRRNSNSDWLKNAIANPQVKVEFDGRKISGSARLIDDEDLARKISCIKYTEKNRQEESRVVLEVNLSNE
jgi:hypothetical protein|tara:strand:+ start:2933 stop:3322 length:390 start_codon:yes stop_codon:yes gene_type:complete